MKDKLWYNVREHKESSDARRHLILVREPWWSEAESWPSPLHGDYTREPPLGKEMRCARFLPCACGIMFADTKKYVSKEGTLL